MPGIYVPDAKGEFRFKEAMEKESRPVLTFEKDTGVILLNFNMILAPAGRLAQDVIMQTHEGQLMGLVITSTAMGPEERARRGIK